MRNEMQQLYANAFNTEQGRKVLGDILTLGHFGETLNPNDPVQVAEYNFAVTVARMAGVFDLVYPQVGIAVKGEEDGSTVL